MFATPTATGRVPPCPAGWSACTPLVLRILESGLPVFGFGERKTPQPFVDAFSTAVEQTSNDDGWAHMSGVAHYISNNSSFSPINHGYKKLGDLIRATELFEVDMRGTAMYIRDARRQ